MTTTASWSSASWIPHLYNSFLVFSGIPKMEWGRRPLSSLLNVSYNTSIQLYMFQHKYTIKSILIVQCMNSCSIYSLRLLFCACNIHSVSVFDVLSQFAMLYMLLSLSLGWTLGTSYRFAHLQMVSRKPAAKVVGTLGILQVSGKSIQNQKN